MGGVMVALGEAELVADSQAIRPAMVLPIQAAVAVVSLIIFGVLALAGQVLLLLVTLQIIPRHSLLV
jgi:type IV secretory pathway VirB3-like protein